MIRSVLISVILSAILIFAVLRMHSVYERGLPEPVAGIDIYDDRITYRTGVYTTLSQLQIGLKATIDRPERVKLHDCARIDDFEVVVDMLRAHGQTQFEVELPRGC